VFGYLGDKWLAGVFPQQWFSVGGPGPQTVSQMNLQYFFVYLRGDGWGIGKSPNMLVNWYANKSGNEVTFPIGLNVSKVIKIGPLPVKFQVQGQYMPVHPDVFGQKWNLQFAITPIERAGASAVDSIQASRARFAAQTRFRSSCSAKTVSRFRQSRAYQSSPEFGTAHRIGGAGAGQLAHPLLECAQQRFADHKLSPVYA
jgi:hypothetical protein